MLYVAIKKRLKDFELNIELEVEEGRTGLLGASGSGKSMTLKAIAGIEKPDEGVIVLNDRILFDSKKKINLPARERRVGYLFQNYALFPNMTVAQNITAGMLKHSKLEKAQMAEQMIQKLCLKGLEQRYPKELSGGQQQRVAIGRMLASKPEILLFDEPFSALDYHLRDQMQEELLNLLQEQAQISLLVSHDVDEAYRLCHRIAVISDGEVAIHEEKEAIFKNPRKLSAAKITGCKNISRAKKLSDHRVLAIDWGIELEIPLTKEAINYIGFRAHHFKVSKQAIENSFRYKIYRTSETRFGKTYLLDLEGKASVHLRYDMDKELGLQSHIEEAEHYMVLPKEKILLLTD